ncbi:GMC oxidoreductase [Prescottella equi]|uniref:GMC oxidoreductase n=1 Tax=Rhodococcus hoagii TaxID=43767 RepID=UPI0027429DF9|nr:GMC oxidoreductase [Prescottella equi]MDP8015162.1 GMC oxidoreductase [Prescottella equi]
MSDVVVIGLGPAGIVASTTLAQAGYAVTALQTTPSAAQDRATAQRCPVASPVPTVRRRATEVAVGADATQHGADGLGGSKLLAAPQSYRLDAWTLWTRTATVARYGPQALTRGADIVDWPVTPGEVDEGYRRIEQMMRVGPRSETAWTRRMTDAAVDLGWGPFVAPAAASADCSGLLAGTTVDVVEGAVLDLETDPSGAVSGVSYYADGRIHRIGCRAVVLAAAVVSTVRLMLLSGLDGGGQVGRYFMAHNCFVANGWFPGIDLQRDAGGPAQAVAIGAFEGDSFDHSGLGFLGGSVLQAAMTGPRSATWRAAVARELPSDLAGPESAAGWVAEHQQSIGTVWAQPDQLARAENHIDLDSDHLDPLGRPVARLTLDLAEDDRRRAAFLGQRMCEWLTAAGARRAWATELQPQPLSTHLYGGARMGHDPATSVVDGFGRCHTVPGLVVVGSSTFPATGGRGPVQTVEALAWRSAVRLARDLS